MTDPVFHAGYAATYDDVYREKEYGAEVDLLQRIFHGYAAGQVQHILDLGCGTGNHSLRLAARGYEVTGIDMSPSMLDIARRKARTDGLAVSLIQGDIRTIRLARRFDAVLMMFAVLGYQTEEADVRAALRTARHHLVPGGLLVCDVWYGPAVISQKPSDRVREIPTEHGKILRHSSGVLEPQRNLCHVRIRLQEVRGDGGARETVEEHTMRFFFPEELAAFLEQSGFSLIRLGAFPEFDRDPDGTTWNVMAVAKALG
jgi:SAM-dependent methyltransferase